VDVDTDAALVQLRIARGLLAASPRAAATALASDDPRRIASDLVRRRLRRAEVDAALADVARIAGRTGEPVRAQTAIALLADRKSSAVKTLRAELRELEEPQAPQAFRVVNGAPLPYRPRDLTFSVLASAVATEAK
jgi:hypothetical protein